MSTPELNKALVKFHAAMGGNIGKNSQGYNYKYADLAATLNAVRGPMAEAGLSVHQTFAPWDDHMLLITTVTHLSGEEIVSKFPLNLNWESLTKGNKLQNIGSTLSYIRRYSLQAILNLATDDDDAVSNSYVAPKQQPKPAPKPVFVEGEDPPFPGDNKYSVAAAELRQKLKEEKDQKLLDWFEQAKAEISEITFAGRLLAWPKENNQNLLDLQKFHFDKFKELQVHKENHIEKTPSLKGK